jgi:hypothetical protein
MLTPLGEEIATRAQRLLVDAEEGAFVLDNRKVNS